MKNRQTNVLQEHRALFGFVPPSSGQTRSLTNSRRSTQRNVLFPCHFAILLFLTGTCLPNHLLALQTKIRRCHQVFKRKSNLVLLNLVKERLYLKGKAIRGMSMKNSLTSFPNCPIVEGRKFFVQTLVSKT